MSARSLGIRQVFPMRGAGDIARSRQRGRGG